MKRASHELTLEFYAELLRDQGCEVTLARTGAEAVAQVRATRSLMETIQQRLDGSCS